MSKSEAKITMSQVCSFLFFPPFPNGEGTDFFFSSDSQREGIFLKLSIEIRLDTKHGCFLPGDRKFWTSKHSQRKYREIVVGLLPYWTFPVSGEPGRELFCASPHEDKRLSHHLEDPGDKGGKGLSKGRQAPAYSEQQASLSVKMVWIPQPHTIGKDHRDPRPRCKEGTVVWPVTEHPHLLGSVHLSNM